MQIGDETKGPNPPVHMMPSPLPITLPVEVPLKDATPTKPTTPKPQEPPLSPAPETPKQSITQEPIVERPSTGPIVIVSHPASEQEVVGAPVDSQTPSTVNVVEPVFPTEQSLQHQQPEAPKSEEQQQSNGREVDQQLSPKPKEISPPVAVQEKQQPADIVVVIPIAKPVVQGPEISSSHPAEIETPSTPEPELQQEHHQQPPSDSNTDGSRRPFDHQLSRVPGTSNVGDSQTPIAAPAMDPEEQNEVPKVKEPAPASQPPVTATESPKTAVEEKKDGDDKVVANNPPSSLSSHEDDQAAIKKPELPNVVPLPPIPHPSPPPTADEAPKPANSVPASEPAHETDSIVPDTFPTEAIAAPTSPIAITDLSTTPPHTPAPANDKEPHKEDEKDDDDDDDGDDNDDEEDDEDFITPQVGQRVILDSEGNRVLSPISGGSGITPDRNGGDEVEEDGGSAEEVVGQYAINNINDKNAPAGKDSTAADEYDNEDDEDDEDDDSWDEDDDKDEEVDGGATVKTEKDGAAAGVDAGLHKRQIPAIGVFGVKGRVVDNKAAATMNNPQEQQQQKEGKKAKAEKEDKKAQRQGATAAAEPIAKIEKKNDTAVDQKAEKKNKAQVAEATMVKDDNHQQQQQQQQDQQKEKEDVVEAQADQKKEKKNKKNKKQKQQKEVGLEEKNDDDFVEEEKADIKNEDDNAKPGPAETDDKAVRVDEGAAVFEDDGRQMKGKKNKKDRKEKKNRQDDNESVGQDQNAIAGDAVNENQNGAAAVNPLEVEAANVKKAHKKHKDLQNQDQAQDTLQADAFPAADDPFAINNNGGAVVHKKGGVHKKDTKDKDTDVQQQQDGKSKNEKPGSSPPSNNNNMDPKIILGTPSVPMSGGGPTDRKAPNNAANSTPAGAGPVTPPKERKGITVAGGGNGYGTVPMFGPTQLDLGSGGVASPRLMIGGQWVASLSVAVLATVFMYL